MTESFDFAIVGGGVIGLSIARQLASTDKVVVVDRQLVGREASWAGAGILPPSSVHKAVHPREKLAALSFQLHEKWATQLRVESELDTGYRKCGAMFVARTSGEVAALYGQVTEWQENDVQVQAISPTDAVHQVAALQASESSIKAAAFVPEESQIRNPDHLSALKKSCQQRGVQFLEEQGDCELLTEGDRLAAIHTQRGRVIKADRFCMAAGAWTAELAEAVGVRISTVPVRGQMLLYKLPKQIFTPIIYEGTRYIVPRDDGHVVVGSTLEEAGFDKSTTAQGVAGLKQFASGLVPELNDVTLSKSWAGLRPASFDGFPYMGPVPNLTNLWIATSHFRAGLLLSTGTAFIMAQMMRGEEPLFDVSPFRVDRG